MKSGYKFFAPIFVIVAFLLAPSGLLADTNGSILGLVRDQSQAVIKGARITVTNTQTNVSQTTVSAEDGSYRFLALPVGTYKLNAISVGFEQFITTDIVVKVNDQLRIDVSLRVGNVQEEVNVAAGAVQVETESTQLGDVIDSKKMLALPLNGRSYLDLLGLQAGVVPVTSGSMQQDRPVSGGYSSSTGNLSVNGQRETANAFLVNGGDVSEGRNLGAGLVPNLDSVEEFRLITNSFDAEYGKFSGAVMNAITKSGTNRIHGDVFEYMRNEAFGARNYFDDTRGELRRNQFGYTLGGPFWKDRLFWFTDYQGTRQTAGASTGALTLPNANERSGNFDPTANSFTHPLINSVTGNYWAQVLSQRLGYTVNNLEPYSASGCTTLADAQAGMCVFPNGVIPQAAWSNPSIGILPFIPQGDPVTGAYSNNSQKDTVSDNKFGQRVDFFNRKTGNWYFYYHLDNSSAVSALSGNNIPGFSSITPTRAQQFVMSNNKTFGANTVNEWRISFFRTATITNKPQSGFAKLADLGFVTGTGTLGIIPSGPTGFPETVPPLYFSNFSMGPNTLTTFQPNNTWQFSEGLSRIIGRHALKVGGEFRYLQINERNTCAPNGDFNFDLDTNGETGNDFADFLLGAPSQYNQCSQQFLDSRSRYGGAYVQDTFKLRENLTLNLGLRWEASMPWYDTQGKIETIVPGLQSTQFPTAPKGWVVPGDPGIPSTLAPTRYKNFGPRLGLAYSPGFKDGVLGKVFGGPGKSSIRASYGMYYTSIEDLNLFYEVGDAPFGLYWVSPNAPMFDQPFLTRSDGTSQVQRFPFTFPVPGDPANQTLDYSRYLPLAYSPGYDIHNRLPYAEHYNLSFQRELTKATVMTLSYVGTQGHRLISQYDANPGNQALCLTLSDPNNVFPGSPTCGPNGQQQTYTLPTGLWDPNLGCLSGCILGTRDKLGPAFSQNNSFTANIANSNYNAGEVTVEHKASDLTLLAAYTYSKGIDNSSGFGQWVNFADFRRTRSLSAYDITHNFVVSYMYALPFDRLFSGAPKRLTQGWTLNGITRFTGGLPVPLAEDDDQSLTGSPNTDVPELIGKVTRRNPRAGTTDCPITNHAACFFNPGAFAPGPFGQFGNSPRQFFHGPGINNTDFGLSKRTSITESTGFEIRAEFFNIFNHAQFNNPVGNVNNSNFGYVTSARDPRIGQLSAKFFW
jgi:carboxypeptidase family protein